MSGASNSLCVDPTEAQFEPVVNGAPNYQGDSIPHNGPFPDTGAACAEFFPEEGTRRTPTNAVVEPNSYADLIPGVSWVGQEADASEKGNAASTTTPRYYIYDEQFTLCANQVAGATLSGEFAADNEAGAFLNGALLATNGGSEGSGGNFNGPTVPFSTTQLAAGVNVLQFVVINENGPTGLIFRATVNTTASCGAGPYWYSNGELIKAGEVVKVTTSGELTFEHFVVDEFEVNCKLTDKETLENPVGGGAGVDTITALKFSHCTYGGHGQLPGNPIGSCKVKAIGLPWHTQLMAGSPVTDEIAGVDVTVKCGSYHETYTGSLHPSVGSSVLHFTETTGELEDQSSPWSPVVGYDELKGPKGDERITTEASEPQWYSNGELLSGEAVVATKGSVTFSGSRGEAAFALTCQVKDEEVIYNPEQGPGADLVEDFTLSNCKGKPSPCPSGAKAEVIAKDLSWPSHLIAGPPIRDVIEDVELEVRCSGSTVDVYEGTLVPRVGNSVEEFGAESGELEDGTKGTLTVAGEDKATGPPEDERITAAG
ncbi:MAG TPA: hypothetical protein VL979_13440 [Solirubrobacteraceae bacterium]|nr:hypothetical protein [Solirubrobacteraceae bacterium]